LFPEPDSSVWLRLETHRIRWMDPESGTAIEQPERVPTTVAG